MSDAILQGPGQQSVACKIVFKEGPGAFPVTAAIGPGQAISAGGLSKFEYAAIHIASGMMHASFPVCITNEECENIAAAAVQLASHLVHRLSEKPADPLDDPNP